MENSNEKLLLHACCGPCSLEPVRLLQQAGINPTIYYTNSNIHPKDEYERRLDTLREWAGKGEICDPELACAVNVTCGAYCPERWEEVCGTVGDAAIKKARALIEKTVAHKLEDAIYGEDSAAEENAGDSAAVCADAHEKNAPPPHVSAYHEALAGGAPLNAAITLAVSPASRQARCRACYRLRFEECAQYAAAHGFDAIGTTLTISPYQYTEIIREELTRAASAYGIAAHFEDYSPCYARATQKSRDIGMYRQNFCGCRISDLEAQAQRAQRKYQRKQRKLAKKRQRADASGAVQKTGKQKCQLTSQAAAKVSSAASPNTSNAGSTGAK